MGRSRNTTQPCLRKELANNLAINAFHRSEGRQPIPFVLNPECPSSSGVGTPANIPGPFDFKPSFFVDAAFFHSVSTTTKLRNVNVSPTQAMKQLEPAFQGRHQKAVVKLAMDLLKVVEKAGLLRGWSPICQASACILGAETALQKNLLCSDALKDMIDLPAKAMTTALRKLREEMACPGMRPLASEVVMKRKGDLCRFPGNPFVPSGDENVDGEPRTVPEIKLWQMKARGGSPLHQVVCSDDLLPPQPAGRACDVRQRGRYYADQQDDELMGFGFEADPKTEGDDISVLPAFESTFADGKEIDGIQEYVSKLRQRQRTAVHMGSAMGNLVCC